MTNRAVSANGEEEWEATEDQSQHWSAPRASLTRPERGLIGRYRSGIKETAAKARKVFTAANVHWSSRSAIKLASAAPSYFGNNLAVRWKLKIVLNFLCLVIPTREFDGRLCRCRISRCDRRLFPNWVYEYPDVAGLN